MEIKTYEDISNLWLNKIINRRRAHSTLRTYGYALKNFADATRITDIKEFNEITLNKYIATRADLAQNTLTLYLIALRQFAQWCYKRGYITEDPFDDYPIEPQQHRLRNYLTLDQLKQLLSYKDPDLHLYENTRNRLAYAFMSMAGLRISEVIHLRVRDIDTNNKQIQVCMATKGNKQRVVPLLPSLDALVTEYKSYLHYRLGHAPTPDDWLFPGRPDTQPITRALINIHLANACAALNLRDISPHCLRHTYATLLARGGASIQALSVMLGHSNIQTTMIYIHQASDQIYAAALLHPLAR